MEKTPSGGSAPLARLALETQRAFLRLAQVREAERSADAEAAAEVDAEAEAVSSADASAGAAARDAALASALASMMEAVAALSRATAVVEESATAGADVVRVSWDNVAYLTARGGSTDEERAAARSAALAIVADAQARYELASAPLANGATLSGQETAEEAQVDSELLAKVQSAAQAQSGPGIAKRLPLDPPGVVLPASFVAAWREGTATAK
uniref:Uncharacterized protein n=1 Tax=Sexangularia sp. CB-2014 TaxID=1486929 RepID=A0A7S1YIY4_9EUKA|mmetsp:Transcript_8505/g.27110  ORF Transcript_8505/g.27110 Transcript_8505/m.27110 type:complete len:212 (+) Transcript_8505:1-636(+)